MNDWIRLIEGDCRAELTAVEDGSVKCCITSPPYWNMSDYPLAPVEWKDGMHTLGKERYFATYAYHLIEVLDAIWPKMTHDGIVWLIVKDDDRGLEREFDSKDWTRGIVDLGSERIYCLANEHELNTYYATEAFVSCYDALAAKHDLFQPYIGYRFGQTPRTLALPMIYASTLPGQVLLDPFAGIGTLGLYAMETQRRAVLIEADPSACEIGRVRLMRGF